jgi:hypothetical protein
MHLPVELHRNKQHHLLQFDRNLDTLTKFKKAIRKEQSGNTKCIPKHFYYGPRKLNIILTQLRNSYSFLNYANRFLRGK